MTTSGPGYGDFVRLLFLHAHCEDSILAAELPEESEQFRFLRPVILVNIKGSLGFTVVKVSVMRVTIPIDLSTCPFIPLPLFLTFVGHLLFLTHLCSYFHRNLSERHMMWVHFERFIGFLCIIVKAWHFFLGSRLLLLWCNKIIRRKGERETERERERLRGLRVKTF